MSWPTALFTLSDNVHSAISYTLGDSKKIDQGMRFLSKLKNVCFVVWVYFFEFFANSAKNIIKIFGFIS